MKENLTIHWFRKDLRLSDNPALYKASKDKNVLPIYILDDINPKENKMGEMSRIWLHHSLCSLNSSLDDKLSFYLSDPLSVFKDLLTRFNVEKVSWSHCYEPWSIKRDKKIKSFLKEKGIEVISENASLLWEPWEVLKEDKTPYKIFTPFYREASLHTQNLKTSLKTPKAFYIKDKKSLKIDSLKLLPQKNWHQKITNQLEIGEKKASKKFKKFIHQNLSSYKLGRDIPSQNSVSHLSAHLHFGEISVRKMWQEIKKLKKDENADHFLSELAWREFSYNQLYYNPHMTSKNLKEKFNKFDWVTNKKHLISWQKGLTGIPMVDAGMRELWQTGYMHNRVRMITASFLVKNLRIHWNKGERWFWETLIDADLASNSANWQWVAGCGSDTLPYFRMFNPVTQGQKFDPEGIYIRKYIPEIAKLPNKYLFNPWEASKDVLEKADIKLGKTYPYPVVDLKKSREEALMAFKVLKRVL